MLENVISHLHDDFVTVKSYEIWENSQVPRPLQLASRGDIFARAYTFPIS